MTSRDHYRLATGILVIVLLLPTVWAGVHAEDMATGKVPDHNNITFVSAQGGSVGWGEGAVFAVDTDTKRVVWEHSSGGKYFDVDPLGEDRVLFVYHNNTLEEMRAAVYDWRGDERLLSFTVEKDTHDVDKFPGTNSFVVADKYTDRIYIYNHSRDQIEWQFNYTKPEFDSDSDYPGTHLNDVDIIENGSYFLTSPRDLDRVHLINRSSKRIVWTLGEEDNHDILYEQHNPALIDRAPPTVLVADSENNRVVEYENRNGTWVRTWSYRGLGKRELSWPRDADRLPNGNTLITDVGGGNVYEVTSNRSVVWKFQGPRSLYDVERLEYGDEPAGPSMSEIRTRQTVEAATTPNNRHRLADLTATTADKLTKGLDFLYQKVGIWILPSWVGPEAFYSLFGSLLVGTLWTGSEVVIRTRSLDYTGRLRELLSVATPFIAIGPLVAALFAIPATMDLLQSVVVDRAIIRDRIGLYEKFTILLALTGVAYAIREPVIEHRLSAKHERMARTALTVAISTIGLLLIFQQIVSSIVSSFTLLFAAVCSMGACSVLTLWSGHRPDNRTNVAITIGTLLGAIGAGTVLLLVSYALSQTYLSFPTQVSGVFFYLLVGTATVSSGAKTAATYDVLHESVRRNPAVTAIRVLGGFWIITLALLLFLGGDENLPLYVIATALSLLLVWPSSSE